MDEMNVKLTTRFMRGIVSKLLAKSIYKKTGYKIDIRLHDLNVSVVDGDTKILTNVEVKMTSGEFVKLMKKIGVD